MPNQIPISGASPSAGGYLLAPEQGDILINGLLVQAGAIALAGDRRATGSRQTQFGVWLGTPTAAPVGEGAVKPATGAEFGQALLNIKKFASVVLFTDEMIEDVQGGDLNVLVDSGVRTAIADVIDAHAVGKDSGVNVTGVFDSMLRSTSQTVEYAGASQDALARAISAAMGKLEGNGYGNVANMAALVGFGFGQSLRDARSSADTTLPIYGSGGAGLDPFYGMEVHNSNNLNNLADAPAATKILGYVVSKPNVHVRIRKDVTVTTSTEATVNDGTTDRKLFQENLTAVRYETRVGFLVHDLNRAVVAIVDAT